LDASALGLILAAAGIHATWNLIAKQSGGSALFVWMFSLLSSVLYAPAAVWIVVVLQPEIGLIEAGFMIGTAALHTFYYVILLRGYRVGDLSLVYPLARSTGPLLATVLAIILLDERPSATALCGGALILIGVAALTWKTDRRSGPDTATAVRYGLMTGVLIAAYTIWDKYAVSEQGLAIPALLIDYSSNVGRTLFLAPFVLRHRDRLPDEWRLRRRAVWGVAVLGPLSYLLVLTAMSFTPASYVAPAREISILFATFLGTRLLGEGHSARRIAATAAMVAGFIAIALG